MAQRSNVFEHFSVNSSDSSRVNCKICNKSIACGGKQATAFNMLNMRMHYDDQRAFQSTGARDRSSTIMEGVEGWGRKETNLTPASP